MVDSAVRSVEFRRVEYDVVRTAEAILASDLPDEFAAEGPGGTRSADLPDKGRQLRSLTSTRCEDSSGADLALRPGVQGVIDRQLELELALVIDAEEGKAVGDRAKARGLWRRVAVL